jgi:hypothetical protein
VTRGGNERAAEQPDAPDEVHAGEEPRPSQVIWVFDGRSELMKCAVIALAAITWCGLSPSAAFACSCAAYVNDPVEAMAKSSLVIAARVVSISRVEEAKAFDGHPMPLVRFQVVREWKGKAQSEYSVFGWYVWPIDGKGAPAAMFDCIRKLRVGERYLVFATPLQSDSEAQSIEICYPIALYREAGEAMAALDKALRHAR